mmetsp:Transcript_4662/g.8133  ORF Transcript_4662/g.8133 Transcript_4662/m.8133 type:complete len:216 (-) Transcript_4662:11-658(-)
MEYSAAAYRNSEPIGQVLREYIPHNAVVLEVASGTGQHSGYFSKVLQPKLKLWIPSDCDSLTQESRLAWVHHARSEGGRISDPLEIDASEQLWKSIESDEYRPKELFELEISCIVNINMIHISPWKCTEGLLAAASRILVPNGMLYLYGPFRQHGVDTVPSNEAFDVSLKSRNPEWGLRYLEDVIDLAKNSGFELEKVISMPANNLSVIFKLQLS